MMCINKFFDSYISPSTQYFFRELRKCNENFDHECFKKFFIYFVYAIPLPKIADLKFTFLKSIRYK